jgi:hypothetical protein
MGSAGSLRLAGKDARLASEERPIFVVGAPRTGTTLVKEILNRHPKIHLFDEVHFFERVWDDRTKLGDLADAHNQTRAIQRVRGIVQHYGTDKDVASLLTEELFRERLQEAGNDYRNLLAIPLKTGAALHGATRWGDSSPQDVLYLSTILDWFPKARVIATVRDPRGFLCSYKNYYRREEPLYREAYNPLTNSILWKSYMSAVLEAKAAPWGEAVHWFRYESLVVDPEAEVRRICEHVGVEYDAGLIDVERMNSSFESGPGYTSRRGIFSTSRDRWRTELTPTEIWVGERVFGKIMKDFGYEPASGNGAPRPAAGELARILAILPGRLINLLFRSGKPFKLAKLKRVLSLFRSPF